MCEREREVIVIGVKRFKEGGLRREREGGGGGEGGGVGQVRV